jgi:asparagine synthase (glutamine-hydrolysing)
MTDALVHRGPDGEGHWIDADAGLALGHRRLSIVDLSDAGSQPMLSASGRYVIVYNGEIYNHLDLRRELETQGRAPNWRGHSDTETLLAAIEAWGFMRTLGASCGMFALALWDRQERTLTLARDRMGEKPLYYGVANGAFVFGSEIKALQAVPQFRPEIDRASVAALLRFLYIPDPFTIYRDVYKLRPGHYLEVRDGIAGAPQAWWSLEHLIAKTADQRRNEPQSRSAEELERTLSEVVRSQMLGDVPIGCFLSGGIDSSLIAALIQAGSSTRLKTYSIGFAEDRFDEAGHAAAVAAHLGTEHIGFTVTETEALAVIPELASIYDEPFADSSQVPTTLLSRLARRDITVALTGDGGDEIFGGYNRYVTVPQAWRKLAQLPRYVRSGLGKAAIVSAGVINPENGFAQGIARRLGLPVTFIDRLAQIGGLLRDSRSVADLYEGLVSVPGNQADILADRPHRCVDIVDEGLAQKDVARWMMANDAVSYLPGDILVKVDRASMSASLETRAPYLDARVVEFAWKLPTHTCIDGRVSKKILREILYRHVPRQLIDRPKQGFSIPLDRWLREGLRDWADPLLSATSVKRFGLFDAAAVRRLWDSHLSGKANHGKQLWAVLMVQAWCDHQRTAV